MRRLAILSAALRLAAREHPGAIGGHGFDVDLDFASRASSGGCFRIPEVTVTGGVGEVVVEGRLAAPTPCQRLRGSADGEGPAGDVTVRIEPVGEACVASIGNFAYTARGTGMAPGDYTLRLWHDDPGADWDPPVQELQVTVR